MSDVTRILSEIERGDQHAAEQLLPLVYEELRRLGLIRDLDVNLAIHHGFNEDLDVTLTHVASGVSVVLFTDVGHNDDGFILRLSDTVPMDIGDVADDANDRAVTGTFNPEGAALLSAFNGLDASGEWRLTIVDDLNAFEGSLFNWSLVISF